MAHNRNVYNVMRHDRDEADKHVWYFECNARVAACSTIGERDNGGGGERGEERERRDRFYT